MGVSIGYARHLQVVGASMGYGDVVCMLGGGANMLGYAFKGGAWCTCSVAYMPCATERTSLGVVG